MEENISTYLKSWNKEIILGNPIDNYLEDFFLRFKSAVVSWKFFRNGNQFIALEIVRAAISPKARTGFFQPFHICEEFNQNLKLWASMSLLRFSISYPKVLPMCRFCSWPPQ